MLVQNRPLSKQFEKTLKENGWEKGHVFRCVSIIPMNESEATADFNQDAYYLQELLDSQYLMIFDNQIFQVINLTQSSLSQNEIDRRLALFMKCNCPYLMGVSIDFQDFSQLSMHMAQARTAARYAAQKDAHPICYYEKDLLSILLGQAANAHGIEFYYTKGIERLIHYDQENHAELLATLFCYLKNMCNVTAATEEMHIGRTTCLYRLKRAQELSHLSLQDEDARLYLMILSHLLKHPSNVISP